MTNWNAIAAEVAAVMAGDDLNLVIALRKATRTGGPDYAPTYAYTYSELRGGQFANRERDRDGTFIKVNGSRLLVGATGAIPDRGDEVMIAGAAAFLAAPVDANWKGIPVMEVEAIAPAGIAVLYKVMIDGAVSDNT